MGQKSIDCSKRKAKIVKLFFKEFDKILDELYFINRNTHEAISSYYESISLEVDTYTSETKSYSDTEDEYWRNRYNITTRTRK